MFQIRAKLSAVNINPYDLSIISQKDCPKKGEDGYNIKIDPDTFSPSTIANAFKKATQKIGDGIEYVAEGTKKLYHHYVKKDDDHESSERLRAHPDTEWLP